MLPDPLSGGHGRYLEYILHHNVLIYLVGLFFLPLSVTIDYESKPSEVKNKLKGPIGIC